MVARRARFLIGFCALVAAVPALANKDGVPYWASVDTHEANMRVGPGDSYQISWVYRRPQLPVKVLRREGPWRLVEDPAGDRGWMRDLLLARKRTAIVTGKGVAEMRAQPSENSQLQWRLQPGIVGILGKCEAGWCQFDASGHKAFVSESRLWGVGEP